MPEITLANQEYGVDDMTIRAFAMIDLEIEESHQIRTCSVCRADIGHRCSNAKYCSKPKECAQIAQRRQNLERMKDPKYRAKAREYLARIHRRRASG